MAVDNTNSRAPSTSPPTTRGSAARLELVDINKRFGNTHANAAVSLRVQPGEIHAILGENGAGKSTLMNVLYGVQSPDSGSVLWNNREVEIPDPTTARHLGIGMVFQHFCLIERLSVIQNLELALPELTAGELRKRFTAMRQRLALAVEPDARVETLSAGERQRVEILRCLMTEVQLLILDEPTSVLTPQEVDGLIHTLKRLAKEGCSILFISHKLAEVEQLCDRATVLRAGRVVGCVRIGDTTRSQLVEMMMGESATTAAGQSPSVPGKAVLHARLERCGRLHQAALDIAAGEIVGIGGVAGSGQEALLNLLSGEQPVARGALEFLGQDIREAPVAARRQLGLRCLPVDRLGRAAAPGLSLSENLLLTHWQRPPLQQGVWIQWGRLARACDQAIAEFDIKAPSAEVAARNLSGGNLQRFLVARELMGRPRLLVCYNPTWGVDPAAAARIHAALQTAREAGTAVLLLSEDIDELFSLCDRLGALCNGRLSPLLPRAQVTTERMGQWMTEYAGVSAP